MKTYLQYQKEMEGASAVAQTVKAAEKIAASSIHFLKQRVAALKIYTSNLEKILARLLLFSPRRQHPLLQSKTRGVRALLLLGGERGLVGSLYHQLTSFAFAQRKNYQVFLVLGSRLNRYLEEEGLKTTPLSLGEANLPSGEKIRELSNFLFSQFRKSSWRRLDLLYPQYLSLTQQKPTLLPFLPFSFSAKEEEGEELGLPLFEPQKGAIFNFLLGRYIQVFLSQIILEAKLSELSARTVASEHAAAKLRELLKKLKLDYLKTRQHLLTQRQLERARSFTSANPPTR